MIPLGSRAWRSGRETWFGHNCAKGPGGRRGRIVRLVDHPKTKTADGAVWLVWSCPDCGVEGMTQIDGAA